jgi:cytochrome b
MNSLDTKPADSLPTSVRVWDLPTRIFHWALALCVIGLLVTGLRGGNAMIWHMRLGYVVFALLLFRVVWGFAGGYWSRFSQFLYSPTTIWSYVRGRSQPAHEVGHNPLGSLSVWALLTILFVQVASGLVSDDEIATQGPLSRFVSSAASLSATAYHKQWGKWIIITLLVLHIAAILFYLLKKKENLIRPMFSGDKSLAEGFGPVEASRDRGSDRAKAALVALVIVSALAYGFQRLG